MSGFTNENNYALLIGVTYPGSVNALPGCDNDARAMYDFLSARGFSHFDVLCDSPVFDGVCQYSSPTEENILLGLDRMVEWSKTNPGGQLFLHYSGHGSQCADDNRVVDWVARRVYTEEKDGADECLVSTDEKLIRDDVLREKLSALPSEANVFALIDACHSGSVLDLKYMLNTVNSTSLQTLRDALPARITMLSGCKDSQTSLSSTFCNKWYGVMTYAFLHLMGYMEKYCINELSLTTFWHYMGIITNDYPQVPQLSCSADLFDQEKILCSAAEFRVIQTLT
jgi:hypothetical protein